MAFSINKLMLLGNIGTAETKFPNDNLSVTNFSVATTHSYKKQGSEDWINETEWTNCVAFNLSEFYQNAIKKGAKFYVEGRKKTEEYEKDGQKFKNVKCIVETIIPLDKNSNESSNNSDDDF